MSLLTAKQHQWCKMNRKNWHLVCSGPCTMLKKKLWVSTENIHSGRYSLVLPHNSEQIFLPDIIPQGKLESMNLWTSLVINKEERWFYQGSFFVDNTPLTWLHGPRIGITETPFDSTWMRIRVLWQVWKEWKCRDEQLSLWRTSNPIGIKFLVCGRPTSVAKWWTWTVLRINVLSQFP